MSDTTSQAKFVNLSSSNDDNWNDVKDSFVQDDNWTQSFFTKSDNNVKVGAMKLSSGKKLKKV